VTQIGQAFTGSASSYKPTCYDAAFSSSQTCLSTLRSTTKGRRLDWLFHPAFLRELVELPAGIRSKVFGDSVVAQALVQTKAAKWRGTMLMELAKFMIFAVLTVAHVYTLQESIVNFGAFHHEKNPQSSEGVIDTGAPRWSRAVVLMALETLFCASMSLIELGEMTRAYVSPH
jgi:hypothetical protein